MTLSLFGRPELFATRSHQVIGGGVVARCLSTEGAATVASHSAARAPVERSQPRASQSEMRVAAAPAKAHPASLNPQPQHSPPAVTDRAARMPTATGAFAPVHGSYRRMVLSPSLPPPDLPSRLSSGRSPTLHSLLSRSPPPARRRRRRSESPPRPRGRRRAPRPPRTEIAGRRRGRRFVARHRTRRRLSAPSRRRRPPSPVVVVVGRRARTAAAAAAHARRSDRNHRSGSKMSGKGPDLKRYVERRMLLKLVASRRVIGVLRG